MEFILQPNVYATGKSVNLLNMLSTMWMRDHTSGDGTLYIISGFTNYNGSVRFLPYFSDHTRNDGTVHAIIGGSTSQRLSSLQVAEALLKSGVQVHVINRKRLLHAKCYGYLSNSGSQELVVTSGNFTGPGMSQNAEAAIRIGAANISRMSFSWEHLFSSIFSQGWDIYTLKESDIVTKTNPGWGLLYNEVHSGIALDESQKMTMIVTLSHSDTARIQADPGTNASKGTQYFWLSKGTFDFFPALTEPNKRGYKNTFSTIIDINYVDLGICAESRVTFEADNNLDFRLGTSALRGTKIAASDDIALITRLNEYKYELRIIKKDTAHHTKFLRYAINYIGNQGKRYGYISNSDMFAILSA